MFVVDSSSEATVQQSAAILRESMSNGLMEKKPLLVYVLHDIVHDHPCWRRSDAHLLATTDRFANKRDQPAALAESKLAQMLELSQFPNSKLVSCVAKPAAFGSMVDDRLEQGLHWLFEQLDRNYDSLNERVLADLTVKKAKDEARRAEQRARVSAWREEREQREMVLHDKPSLVPGSSSVAAVTTVASTASSKQQEHEDDVIYCSNCTTQPAVTKCAASKWMPVCTECASELKSAAARNQ